MRFQSWHSLCIIADTDIDRGGEMRHHSHEWMHKMTLNRNRMFATMVVSGLFAASALATENQDAVAETAAATTADTAELNRNRAESANTAAVEDAIEAVLADNKLELDIRFIGRTSVTIADSR